MAICAASPTPTQPFDKDILMCCNKGYDVHMSVKFLQHTLERVSLRRRARKTIQNSTNLTVRTSEPIFNHGNGDIIRNQFAFRHIYLSKFSQLGLIPKVLT